MYNGLDLLRWHSSIKKTPKEYLDILYPEEYPWEILKSSSFDYNENKKKIEQKMRSLAKTYPPLCPLHIVTKKNLFSKKTEIPSFSPKIFYCYYIKRPILSNESFLFKLIDASGKVLNKAYSIFDIKKATLKSPDKFKINKIISKESLNGQTLYNVNIEQFPKSMIFKLEKSQLHNFRISNNCQTL